MILRLSFVRTSLVPLSLLAAACQTLPSRSPVPPALQLTAIAPMRLDAGCQVSGSVVVEFKVLPDGATGEIQAPLVPDCLHDALTAWVASFRYTPPGEVVPSSVEWLLVTARKGS